MLSDVKQFVKNITGLPEPDKNEILMAAETFVLREQMSIKGENKTEIRKEQKKITNYINKIEASLLYMSKNGYSIHGEIEALEQLEHFHKAGIESTSKENSKGKNFSDLKHKIHKIFIDNGLKYTNYYTDYTSKECSIILLKLIRESADLSGNFDPRPKK